MRKKNLSVYDIQRDLASAGHAISINALTVLLREEGFARLPRRRDEERPSTLKAEAARRRSKKMLGEIWSRPASAWRRITLRSLTRSFRIPKVLDERIELKEYGSQRRQVTVIDLGHEEPTILLTNNFKISCSDLITRYAQRMLIENGISEAIQFFHLAALSSMIGLKVDFDLQITLMASSLYRLMAQRIGREYNRSQAKKIFRNLLDVSATVVVEEHRVIVKLDKRAHNPYLVASGLTNSPTPMPWFAGKDMVIEFS